MENKAKITEAFKGIGDILFAMRKGFMEAGFTKLEAMQMVFGILLTTKPKQSQDLNRVWESALARMNIPGVHHEN